MMDVSLCLSPSGIVSGCLSASVFNMLPVHLSLCTSLPACLFPSVVFLTRLREGGAWWEACYRSMGKLVIGVWASLL